MAAELGHGSLADLRVLDASNLIAGPLATMLLADLGAEVIKIEHPNGGDSLAHPRRPEEWSWSVVEGARPRQVQRHTRPQPSPAGQTIFRRLAADVDVVVENFRPGTMARWGLDYAALSSDNPGLVMAHVTGFGQTGPLSSQPGFGTLAESMSGFAARNGPPDGPPTLPPFGLADTVTGITAAFAIMSALWARRANRHGTGGRRIDHRAAC